MNADTQAEDTVVVQGIIDICGEAEESLWLIDYKTDRIKEGRRVCFLTDMGIRCYIIKQPLNRF